MASARAPAMLIANLAAGRGRASPLPRLAAALVDLGIEHRVAVTRHRGHAEELAQAASADGVTELVVAVGGDGTVHEVVNGLVDAATGRPRGSAPALGLVSAGSGADFARTFGLDRAPERLARHLAGDATMALDLGRVRLTAADGEERLRLFANVAQAGYGGLVVARAAGLPRRLGRLRYLAATLSAVGSFRLVATTVTIAHGAMTEPLSNVVIANGQFFGGGLKVAPRALPNDGRLNVQLWRGTARDVFALTPKVRTGDHLGSGQVREYQSATATVSGATPLVVEADGEVLGATPATFDVLPQVLRLRL